MALVTWAFIGLILLLVVALVVVKLTEGTQNPAAAPPPAAPTSVVAAIAGLPASSFDAAGVSALSAPEPQVLSGQPLLETGGKPEVVFVGADFSPFSAAESWVVVIALSRFGTFSHLGQASSSKAELFRGTPEFTFEHVQYRSSFVSLEAVDAYAATPNTVGAAGFAALENPGPALSSLMRRYGVQGASPTLPFVDVGNRLALSGGAVGFSPGLLEGMSLEQVAADVSDPTSAQARALLGAANILSAAICTADGGRPALVCQSPAVQAAGGHLGTG